MGLLARLEEEHSHLPQVEVDEVLRLVRHVGPEVAAHDRVPGGVVLLVELFLDVSRDVLLDVVLLERLAVRMGRGGRGFTTLLRRRAQENGPAGLRRPPLLAAALCL